MNPLPNDAKLLEPPRQERRRWIKVDVDDDLFARLHVMAAESRMRFQTYLRRSLADSKAYRPTERASERSRSDRHDLGNILTESQGIESAIPTE